MRFVLHLIFEIEHHRARIGGQTSAESL